MSLLLNDALDLWRPSTVLGLSLSEDDILSPFLQRKLRRQLASAPYCGRHVLRHKEAPAKVSEDKAKFQVCLDVSHFNPEEISVKASAEGVITVEGDHGEKEDEHGWISRRFVRRYKVPEGHDMSKCSSKLSSDGVLTVTVPKSQGEGKDDVHIPVTFTNKPVGISQKNKVNEPLANGFDS